MTFGENTGVGRNLVEAGMSTRFEFAAKSRVNLRELNLVGEGGGERERQDVPVAKIANRHPLNAQVPAPVEDARKPPVTLLLIDSRSLFREGIKIMLRHSGYSVVAEADNVTAALSKASLVPTPQLILFGLHLDGVEGISSLKALRDTFAASRLVVQADPIIEPALVLEAFRQGIDAWLTLSVSSAVLVRSLDLAMSGERIFPAAAIMAFAGRAPAVAPTLSGGGQNDLSSRETGILHCLAAGHSNKMIARELNMTDGTVKGMLKALFQKIGAANRTQAAVWAIGGRPSADPNRA
jgi:two-component system nitrate/nitrite response regulator NarL